MDVSIINESVEHLFLGSNLLETVRIDGAPNLRSVMLTSNRLAEVDLSSNTLLETALLSNNQIAGLDLSQNSELAYLYISSNALQKLDVSGNQKLVDLRPNRNPALTCIKIASGQEIPVTRLDDYQGFSSDCEL